MERVKGKSGRQGSSPGKAGACGVLDSRFAGVEYSIHPDPNPLHVSGSLRLRFFPRDPHHVKNPLSGTLRGAGEGNRTLDASLGSSNFAIKLHPQG